MELSTEYLAVECLVDRGLLELELQVPAKSDRHVNDIER